MVVTSTARQDLADLLRDVKGGGSFSTRRTAPIGDLSIEVRGVGPLRLPVPAAQAKDLRLIARPARYGKGEDTLLDRRVRDTWEIARSRVSIDARRWANTLGPMLRLVRDDLGLPPSASLDADLHSMLVYEPGQFFAAHQDSENHDRMIGSLVVLLPSRGTGGDLVVSHRGETVTYRGSATALTFVAFYSDTRHEVLPVETGYRVALTYNLRLAGSATDAGPVGAERAAAAAGLVRQHFATPVEPRWRHDSVEGEPPDRLVFLLDHHYSEHSLRWAQLKGDDATRASVLREAAELTGCDTALALAEVHETWDVEYVEYRRGRRGWSNWDDDGPDRDDVDALGDLMDSDVEIHPVEDRPVGARHVANVELALVTPSVELEPYDTEYTGNMGNYGNTMDRWYRRAAVVIWPRSRAFALMAHGDPAGAVDEVLAIKGDDPDEHDRRADMTRTLLRFWAEGVREHDERQLLARTLILAERLVDAELAELLLDRFALEAIGPADAEALVAVVDRYGHSWFEERLTAWMTQRSFGHRTELPTRTEWVVDLDTLCERLVGLESLGSTVAKGVALSLTVRVWEWLRRTIDASHDIVQPSARRAALASLGAPFLAVLHSAENVGAADLGHRIIDAARNEAQDLTPMLLATIGACAPFTPAQLVRVGLDPLAGHCANVLAQEVARPKRHDGDWSIAGFHQAGCCQDCAELAGFVADSVRTQHVWPMAKPRREHIHRRIDEAELPVTHQTRRDGSPHKLVLTKTADVYNRDEARRIAARTELDTVERFLEQINPARS